MNKKGVIVAGIFALLFVPGTIPAFIAVKSYKLKKRLALQKNNIEG